MFDLLLQNDLKSKWNDFKSELTSRETEIVNLLATKGYSNNEIAEELKITRRTTEAHFGAIFKKANRYGWNNRTQIAIAFWKNKLS
jgi:DNA-binding NarL/FixJ family response regulator